MTFEEFYENHCVGEINFLKSDKELARLVYERCNDDNCRIIMKKSAGSGFIWGITPEGYKFWSKTFHEKHIKNNLNNVD